MLINYKLQTLNLTNDVNDLLCQIDTRISTISKDKLDSKRYGAKICIDWGNFEILVKYRRILEDKANNSLCLKGYLIDDIISNIKQYLSSGKIQKFKKAFSEDVTISQASVTQDNIQVIVKNNFGDLTVNNNNSFVTRNEDTWDQVGW